jgi:hypothetical protein
MVQVISRFWMGKPESKGGNGYRNIVKVETTATIRGDHVFKMTPGFLCLVFWRHTHACPWFPALAHEVTSSVKPSGSATSGRSQSWYLPHTGRTYVRAPMIAGETWGTKWRQRPHDCVNCLRLSGLSSFKKNMWKWTYFPWW